MSVMIEAKGVGKKFDIRPSGVPHYKTMRDTLAEIPKKLFSGGGNEELKHQEFWSLKDVNFTINEGEVVGIIGRNGAGKSTLLKMISQITAPTEGEISIHGRVGSLLEVGTGFHPELTGRENIFMNGAILGMSHAEILKKFDAIVDFSGVEEFLDVPIKRYSSGMRMRLAFSVAAHLEPEIMIVDEVLAVGDAEFQKKCLAKMKDVSNSGRTILFVSHSMGSVQSLCSRGFVLDSGRMVFEGQIDEVVKNYMQQKEQVVGDLRNIKHRIGNEKAKIVHIEFDNGQGQDEFLPYGQMNLTFTIERDLSVDLPPPIVNADIKTFTGIKIARFNTDYHGFDIQFDRSQIKITLSIENLNLLPGTYILDFAIGREDQMFDMILDTVTFEVREANLYGTGKMPPKAEFVVDMKSKWAIEG